MTRQLVASYAASVARVLSWAAVFGIVYRTAGENGTASVALLALARSTVGLLGYLSLGLTPVLVRMLTPDDEADPSRRVRAFSTAGVLMGIAAGVGVVLLLIAVWAIDRHSTIGLLTPRVQAAVFLAIGYGTLLRAASEWPASALLAGGRIATDGVIQAAAEILFVALACTAVLTPNPVAAAAGAYAFASSALLLARAVCSGRLIRPSWRAVDRQLAWPILVLGGGVLLGQLADWLYAPLNQVLINRHLDAKLGAAYAIAIQIDAGLLLAVAGLATVLLPTAALLHSQGRLDELRKKYVVSTLAGLLLLAGGAMMACVVAEPLFILWFGDSLPAARAILPWVLLHTVIGGTATTGRAVLLGIGEVKAYTIAAIVGGVANAVLATIVVTQTSLGLRGIVLATVVTVALRCGLWMPWYTLRCLRPINPSPIKV